VNIAHMTDDEITTHVERLAKTVEEKNVLVGAILRAELDDFLRNLREGAQEAQAIPAVPNKWEIVRQEEFSNFNPGEKAWVEHVQRTGHTMLRLERDGQEYRFVLPRGMLLVRPKAQAAARTMGADVAKGVSIGITRMLDTYAFQAVLTGQPPAKTVLPDRDVYT
jgi:hypothetical protein